MSLDLPSNIREILAETADAARGDQQVDPILLERVCAMLQVSVERRSSVPQGKAFLAWDRIRERTPRILLPLEKHRTWDRFCAAHELGHFVLISEYDWMPKGKKQYWETEELCDFFARSLLIARDPEDLRVESAHQVIKLCDNIARSSIVPWKQAAEFVSENSAAYVLVLELDQPKRRLITGSTLPKRQGRMATIPDGELPMQIRNAVRKVIQGVNRIEGSLLDTDFMRGKLQKLIRDNFEPELRFRVDSSGRLIIAGMRR